LKNAKCEEEAADIEQQLLDSAVRVAKTSLPENTEWFQKKFAFSNFHYSLIILPSQGRTDAHNHRDAPTMIATTPIFDSPGRE